MSAANILGARRLFPIHYGVTPSADYTEVDDPIGQLRKAARAKRISVQAVVPGAWVDWAP